MGQGGRLFKMCRHYIICIVGRGADCFSGVGTYLSGHFGTGVQAF